MGGQSTRCDHGSIRLYYELQSVDTGGFRYVVQYLTSALFVGYYAYQERYGCWVSQLDNAWTGRPYREGEFWNLGGVEELLRLLLEAELRVLHAGNKTVCADRTGPRALLEIEVDQWVWHRWCAKLKRQSCRDGLLMVAGFLKQRGFQMVLHIALESL